MNLEPIWVDQTRVLIIHDRQLAEHGGGSGVRDESLLASALARPRNLLAGSEESRTLYRLAAAYSSGISSDHPFIDGNQRTALVVCYLFLALNGIEIQAAREDVYLTFLGLVEGRVSPDALARWCSEHGV